MGTHNKCQFWREDESLTCTYWSRERTICTYKDENDADVRPIGYPYCNLIGTKVNCDKYNSGDDDSTAVQSVCILPDPTRHVCRRYTGNKWVYMLTGPGEDEEGNPQDAQWTFDDVTGYSKSDGKCVYEGSDKAGSNPQCTAYSPYHIGFGKMRPGTITETDIDANEFTAASGIGFRVPMSYTIYNMRAQLSRCYWWNGDWSEFTVNSNNGAINTLAWKCVYSAQEDVEKYRTYLYDEEVGMVMPPCNGAKAECPHYTGVCWKYCIDEKLGVGDKVLAEQIQELRYYIKRNKWTKDSFESYFDDSHIYALKGAPTYAYDEDGAITHYSIPAVQVWIESFDSFLLSSKDEVLTEGTKREDGKGHYPTLVRAVNSVMLQPLIMNKFDTYGGESDSINIFEVGSFSHEVLYIYGYTPSYDETVYGLNINDSVLSPIKKALRDYTDMYSIKAYLDSLKSDQGAFNVFQDTLDSWMQNVITFYPDKSVASERGGTENSFFIPMPTVWGENDIVVFVKINNVWVFDRIKFYKVFCGGMLYQTLFEVNGDGGYIYNPPNYEEGFYGDLNNHIAVEFSFHSFVTKALTGGVSAIPFHYYDDLDLTMEISIISQRWFGARVYKITLYENIIIDSTNIHMIGNAGYMMIDIPDPKKRIHSFIKQWEIEGGITLSITTGDGDSDYVEVSMAIVDNYSTSDFLEVNQIIVKPNTISDFITPCRCSIVIGKLYIYEKYSYGDTPADSPGLEPIAYEDVTEEHEHPLFISETDVVEIDNSYKSIRISKFHDRTMVPSVLFRGRLSGRVKGGTRTKLITYVRQPYCRDVEIYYRWQASYRHVRLHPGVCYGEIDTDEPMRTDTKRGTSPACGDHDGASRSFRAGFMWYPYTQCLSSARYRVSSTTMFWMPGIYEKEVELFLPNAEGVKEYGAWNMRMVANTDMLGSICGTKMSILSCHCDFWYCNSIRTSTVDKWVGQGNYRGGLDGEALLACVPPWPGGTYPRFGNVPREILQSFRSMDYFKVLKDVGNGSYIPDNPKWLPMHGGYTCSDVTAGSDSYTFDLLVDDGPLPIVHPMGLYKAIKVEGIDINEEFMMDDEGEYKRYVFSDVFSIGFSDGTYPYGKVPQYDGLFKVTPYFTFKQVEDKQIMWAWQEPWKPLERNTEEEIDTIDITQDYGISINYDYIPDYVLSPPFIESTGVVKGLFRFIELYYPNYLYNYGLKEFTTVVSEGEHKLTLYAPMKDEKGEYLYRFFAVQLNNGPPRCFDIYGNWEPNEMEGIEDIAGTGYNGSDLKTLYETCTVYPWYGPIDNHNPYYNVNLFDTGYDSKESEEAREAGRRIVKRGFFSTDYYYFHRGINIVLNSTLFNKLPKRYTLYSPPGKEIKFSNKPVPDIDYTDWDTIETNIWYPLTNNCMYITYSAKSPEYVDIVIRMTTAQEEEKKALGKVVLEFAYGKFVNGNEVIRYHLPEIELFSGIGVDYPPKDEEALFTSIYKSEGGMTICDKDTTDFISTTIQCDLDSTLEYVFDTYDYLKIRMRNVPTSGESSSYLPSEFYSKPNYVRLNCIYLYTVDFTDAVESIKTYERKYNVSIGNFGDYAPNNLYADSRNKSTAYQRDNSSYAIAGESSASSLACRSMNKTYGRLLGKSMKYSPQGRENIASGYVDLEQKQADVFNKASFGLNNFGYCDYKCILPPGLSYYMDKVGCGLPDIPSMFSLTNTFMFELMPVKTYSPVNPAGHYIRRGRWNAGPMQCPTSYFSGGLQEQMVWQYEHIYADDRLGGSSGPAYSIEDRYLALKVLYNVIKRGEITVQTMGDFTLPDLTQGLKVTTKYISYGITHFKHF